MSDPPTHEGTSRRRGVAAAVIVVAMLAAAGWWAYNIQGRSDPSVHGSRGAVAAEDGTDGSCLEPSRRWLLNLKDWFHFDYQKAEFPEAAYVARETDHGTVYIVAIRIVAPGGDDMGVATFASNALPTLAHPRLFEPINTLALQATDEGRAENDIAPLGAADGASAAERCLI